MALQHIAVVLYGGDLGDGIPVIVPDKYSKQVGERLVRMVLLVLAYHANKSDIAYPTAATVASALHLDEGKVRCALRVLQDPTNGYIRKVGSYKVHSHGTKYQLCLPDGEDVDLQGDGVVFPSTDELCTAKDVSSESTCSTPAYDKEEVKKKPKRRRTLTLNDDDLAQFELFWEIYPRKEMKDQALSRWVYSLSKATGEKIIDGANRFALDQKYADEEFIPLAKNWLYWERWLDEY